MHAVTIVFLVATTSLLNLVDAHGFHHPTTRDEDPSFDNLVEQKYPTLADLDPNFVANHRRKLAEDFTHDSKNGTSLVCGNCYKSGNKWHTCDDLVSILRTVYNVSFHCLFALLHFCRLCLYLRSTSFFF